MLITTTFSPVFAASTQFLYVNEVSTISVSNVYADGSVIGTVSGYGDIHVGTNLSDVYIGLVVSGGYNDFYFIVPNSVTSSATNFMLAYSSVGGQNPASTASTGSGYKAYRNRLTGTYTGDLIPFSTVSDMLSTYSTWTPPEPTPVSQGYTKLEVGNIVYFDLGANKAYDISMQSEFYSYSGVLSGTWPDDNRRYGFVNELPTANTNLAESAGTSILWSDDTDGQTILGTNNKGIASISGTTTGRYMWVINPLYNNKYYDDALNAKAINGVMKIYGVPSGTTVYTYKLKQNATSLGLDNVIPSVSGGVGTVSENEGEQTPFTSTDDNETPYTQTVGGDTSAPGTVSAIEGVRQTLDQFVNAFLNLLTAPADHIQQLISAGSAFMQAITGIFTWLPDSVVDVFTSALILMIVIGVLKMLL